MELAILILCCFLVVMQIFAFYMGFKLFERLINLSNSHADYINHMKSMVMGDAIPDLDPSPTAETIIKNKAKKLTKSDHFIPSKDLDFQMSGKNDSFFGGEQ